MQVLRYNKYSLLFLQETSRGFLSEALLPSQLGGGVEYTDCTTAEG